jgi:hypothetical protein
VVVETKGVVLQPPEPRKVDPPKEPIRLEMEAVKRRIEAAFQKVAPATPVPLRAPMPAQAIQARAFQVQVQNINMMAQQWEPQIRGLLRTEYRFMRTVCEPSKEQRLPIVRESDPWVKEAAKQFAEWQMNGRRVAGGSPGQPDFRALLVEHLSGSVKTHLSASQFERYRKELDARAADEKQVAVLNLVAKLDQNLLLSPDQRDRLKESLTAGWDESWSQNLQMFQLADQYMPSIPDDRIVPYLNATQRGIWSGLQKLGRVSFGIDFGVNEPAGPLDEDWADEPKARP